MDVLAVTHGADAPAGVFGDVVVEAGHRLNTWSALRGAPPEDYDALLVFGGSMHADEEERHPWLVDELDFLGRALAGGTPVLGVCLGAQLLAKAAGADVYRADAPEIGWYEVELTEAAGADPVLGGLPSRFEALQWHHYTFDLPAGAVELAGNAYHQAFRVGSAAWGIQFHAEVTPATVDRWIDEAWDDIPGPPEQLRARTRQLIGRWNQLGRSLAGAFLEQASLVRS